MFTDEVHAAERRTCGTLLNVMRQFAEVIVARLYVMLSY